MPDKLDDILESPEHTLLATDLGNTEGPSGTRKDT